MAEKTMVIINELGFHARPCAVLVSAIKTYNGTVKFNKGGKNFDCKSVLGMLSAGVKKGDEITLKIEGDDDQAMLDKVIAMIEKFD